MYNGKIFTVNPLQPWAEAVAIDGRRFVAVGSDAEILALANNQTRTINLKRRLVLPGLCDSHIHFHDWSLSRQQVPVAGWSHKEDMLAAIEKWASKEQTGSWLIGRGWNESIWLDQTLPTRSDLDRVIGHDRPALFWRSDMHAAVASSAALRIAGIDASTADPEGGVIGRSAIGEPNGLLWELAINQVSKHVPKPSASELDRSMVEAMAELHQLGVTAIHDQRMKDQDEGPLALAAYQRLALHGLLNLRVNSNIASHDLPHLAELGLSSGFGNDFLRLGHIKLFADGSMGSRTAWLLTPYRSAHIESAGYAGISVTPPEQLAAEIRLASATGFPVSVHAIGDRANREVLDIFEELSYSIPRLSVPHRIEHVQILDPVDIPRLARLDLTASVQPLHLLDDLDTAMRVLGEQAGKIYNFGSLLANGTRLALGSDAPVADPNPFLGFHAAIFRQLPGQMTAGPWHGEERLTLEETIYGYTIGAAESAGWQKVIGSIQPGKRADMIVLDRDLFDLISQHVSGSEIADTQVLMTLFDGEVVYERDKLSVP